MFDIEWRAKPFPILASVLWWGASAIFAPILLGCWQSSESASGKFESPAFTVLLFSFTLCLSFAILVFLRDYWLGHEWARYFAILSVGMGLWRDIRAVLWLFPNYPRFWALIPLALVEFAFNLYLLEWLLSGKSRDHFGRGRKVA